MTDTATEQARETVATAHAVDAERIARALSSDVRHGLGHAEASARLGRYGPNRLEEAPPTPAWVTLLAQFRSPLIYILVLAALATIVLGEHIDAAVIAAVLALNAAIGFFQERRAEASVRSLMHLVTPHAKVLREGREWDVDSADVVPGDVVLLESGVRVAADLRLAVTHSLAVDESMLTGESLAVGKHRDPVDADAVLGDRRNMAYAGTIVSAGRGRGVVVATGVHTELGAIAEQVRGAEEIRSPLQDRMARFASVIGVAVATAATITMVSGLLLGEPLDEMFLTAVALAVASIPEGLPVVLTIALALGMRRMAHRNAIVRRLPAVETLGSTTLIGSDKTGTLTENRMTVQEIWAAGVSHSLAHLPHDPQEVPARDAVWDDADALTRCLLAGVVANESQLFMTETGVELQGDPTETALLVAAARHGFDPDAYRRSLDVVADIPFESERRYAAALRDVGDRRVVFVKGAPERVLEMCTAVADDGRGPFTREEVQRQADEMAARGLRVLATAYAPLPDDHAAEHLEPERLTLLGLQGMLDPPRPGVREAIEGCRRAGLRVAMITGDHARTAEAIARDLGIGGDDPCVMTGIEVEQLTDEELRERLAETSVFARVSPEHKLRIVRAARARGDVVAVTGDGVNDAPALKSADIGVAMGREGTDVAREAADMVLADDNFVSIHAAVEEGRVTFDNVRKVSFFLISTGAATILLIPTAMYLGWPLVLLPAQLLWLNLVTNGLQDVALAFEPGEPDVLERPPRRRSERVISPLLWERTALVGVVMAAGTLALYAWERDRASLEEARTVALTTLVVFMAFHVGNVRSEHRSLLRVSLLSNRFLFFATIGAVSLHAAALYLPPTQYVLRVEPIDLAAWIRIFAVATSVLVAVEAHKALRRRLERSRGTGGVRRQETIR